MTDYYYYENEGNDVITFNLITHEIPVSGIKARELCMSEFERSTLASITDRTYFEFVLATYQPLLPSNALLIIGLETNTVNRGVRGEDFFFSNGEPEISFFEVPNVFPWKQNQPGLSLKGTETGCVVMDMGGSGLFVARKCSDKLSAFILCRSEQQANSIVDAESPPVPTASPVAFSIAYIPYSSYNKSSQVFSDVLPKAVLGLFCCLLFFFVSRKVFSYFEDEKILQENVGEKIPMNQYSQSEK